MKIYVPSSGRPEHVNKYADLDALDAFWVVPPDEVTAYEERGANVLGIGSRYGAATVRNSILEHAGNADVAMVDDDISKVIQVDPDTKVQKRISLSDALEDMLGRLTMSDMNLIGVAPTANAFFANRRTSLNLFAKSTVWVIRPSELRMDEVLRVKGDYDFCLQHLQAFGGWLRADDLLVHHQQRAKVGGCVVARDDGANDVAVEHLLQKWPGLVKRHATREGEVTLTVPKARRG